LLSINSIDLLPSSQYGFFFFFTCRSSWLRLVLMWVSHVSLITICMPGRAVAKAVRRWLPTAAARVRVQAACGVCGGQSGIGIGFLRVLRFPLPIIPPISPS
jgi:hypothetical protein